MAHMSFRDTESPGEDAARPWRAILDKRLIDAAPLPAPPWSVKDIGGSFVVKAIMTGRWYSSITGRASAGDLSPSY